MGWIKWLAGAGLSIHPANFLLLPVWIMRVPCLNGTLSLAYSLWIQTPPASICRRKGIKPRWAPVCVMGLRVMGSRQFPTPTLGF